MTPMNVGILDGIFFFSFYDRKLSSPTRKSCTLPHCLTSGRYGRGVFGLILVPPLFIEGNSHSYNRTIFVFARATVPY